MASGQIEGGFGSNRLSGPIFSYCLALGVLQAPRLWGCRITIISKIDVSSCRPLACGAVPCWLLSAMRRNWLRYCRMRQACSGSRLFLAKALARILQKALARVVRLGVDGGATFRRCCQHKELLMQAGMFSGLFAALTTEHRMNFIANNLANVNTDVVRRMARPYALVGAGNVATSDPAVRP